METKKVFRNDRLTFRLHVLAQTAIDRNDAIFLRETSCSIRELRVLRLVADNPGITFVEITQLTKLERSLTSRIIQRLLTEGLISRQNLPKDARRFGLYITEEGSRVRLTGRAVSDRLETILTEPLSREELDRLDEILERLALWVDSPDYQQRLVEQ